MSSAKWQLRPDMAFQRRDGLIHQTSQRPCLGCMHSHSELTVGRQWVYLPILVSGFGQVSARRFDRRSYRPERISYTEPADLLHERVIDGMPSRVRLFHHQPMFAMQPHNNVNLNLRISCGKPAGSTRQKLATVPRDDRQHELPTPSNQSPRHETN